MAAVKVGGKWGYINQMGKIVIMPQFTSDCVGFHPGEFHGGIASITPYLFINTKGKQVWPKP